MSKSTDNFPTGAQIAELRAELPWESAKGNSVLAEVNRRFSLKLTSIIPLRNALNAHLAENGELKLAKTAKAIVAARDKRGYGFPKIAAATGLPVAEVKRRYVQGGGLTAESGGRTYVRRDGSVTVLAPTNEEESA